MASPEPCSASEPGAMAITHQQVQELIKSAVAGLQAKADDLAANMGARFDGLESWITDLEDKIEHDDDIPVRHAT